jgi:serine protease Do
MPYRYFRSPAWLLIAGVTLAIAGVGSPSRADDTNRRTPLVEAIASCQFSVVNLRGQKTVSAENNTASREQVRHVNGMGTGVVIDPRGYILTNFHVVEEVKQIHVTTNDRQSSAARLLARDPVTDLAIIKVEDIVGLKNMKLGTSSDLMLAETVAAVGNAYGYEHTVTTGIVSHLRRTVQINENQIYENLIQTDAPINPGNSGGPLLNLDGQMVGVNVAVRVGAQGIAFAIPVDEAVEVASRLLAQFSETSVVTGLQVVTRYTGNTPSLYVSEVETQSAAERAGLQSGDLILSINGVPALRSLDWQCALLERKAGEMITLMVDRSGPKEISLELAAAKSVLVSSPSIESNAWTSMGLRFSVASEDELKGKHPNYQRGLRVTAVRQNSPAEKEGIRVGDVLVAMHGWKTESFENLGFILDQPEVRQNKHFMFYILRDREPYFGQMRLVNKGTELK